MHKNDYVNRFLFDDTDIRGEIVALENTFKDATEHQKFPPELTPVFGEFLAAAALLAEVLKFEGVLTLQARGEGDIAMIMAEANHQGHLRGIVRTQPEKNVSQLADLSLDSLMGNNAILSITIDPIKGKRYQGIVPIDKSKLAECLEEYFRQSEQLLTQIQLFSSASQCAGLFLQCLPPQVVTDLDKRKDNWDTCIQLAATIKPEEMFELHNEEILTRLFHQLTCRVFTPKPIELQCLCNRQRSATALQSLGYKDALALIGERDLITIDCQFCGKTYSFSETDLEEVFPDQKGTMH